MAKITLINSFKVPAGRDEQFMALWTEVNTYMRQQPGYLSHRLHRAIEPDGQFRFVNVADWESHESFDKAHDDGFWQLVRKPEWQEFPAMPALFEVVHENHA